VTSHANACKRQVLTFQLQFDLQRDAASRVGAIAGGVRTAPLFTASATAAAANINKENSLRRRSSSLKEGSPLKAPLPRSNSTKRARLSSSLMEEGEDDEDVEALIRAKKKKGYCAVGGGGGRRMGEAESATVIMGTCQCNRICCSSFAVCVHWFRVETIGVVYCSSSMVHAFEAFFQVPRKVAAAAEADGSVCETCCYLILSRY
jgi:hypothetical protein